MIFAAAAALFAALLSGTALPAAGANDAAQTDETNAAEFAAAIERFNAIDPQSPYTLNARLDFAAFLVHQTGDCRTRLDDAQSQLDLVKSNPALEVVVPAGLARLAGIEYQVHSARAQCAGTQLRDSELRTALQAAQRAVGLYRDAFDAVSMVTMQFNCSVAYHDLGNSAAAESALQEAIALDREYGYPDDAEDNYALLLQWNNQEPTPDRIAERMQDFPERSATLAFGWLPSVAELHYESDYTQAANGQIMKLHSARSAQRQIRKHLSGWTVAYQASPAHFELAELPTEDASLQGFGTAIADTLLHFHDFKLSNDGDFEHTDGTFKFDFRVRADSRELTGALAARGIPTEQIMRQVSKALRTLQRSQVLESLVDENYNFATGTWIGATLEQGVWYNMTASLSLLLDPQVFLNHNIEFAYTRPMPCVENAQESACIEIVLRATADPAVLKVMLNGLAKHLPSRQLPQLQSITQIRLIVDPISLVAYRRDVRRYSYWSDGSAGANHALAADEKSSIVSGSLTADSR